MNDDQIYQLIGNGAVGAALVGLIWKVGLALVAAIKYLREEIAEHTKLDLAHHAKVMQDLAEMRGEIAGIAYERERTPVGPPPKPATPARGVRIPRPGTADKPWGDDR